MFILLFRSSPPPPFFLSPYLNIVVFVLLLLSSLSRWKFQMNTDINIQINPPFSCGLDRRGGGKPSGESDIYVISQPSLKILLYLFHSHEIIGNISS